MGVGLERWRDEPRSRTVLAVFGGQAPMLQEFVDAWVEDGQPLALPAVRLDPLIFGDHWPGSPRPIALAIDVSSTPQFWIHWWMNRQTHWRVFHLPVPAQPKADDSGDVYFPWGQVPSDRTSAQLGIKLVWSERLCLVIPTSRDSFDDLFRQFVAPSFMASWEVREARAEVSGPPRVQARLRLGLVEDGPSVSTNSARELARLELRIRELEVVAGLLRWQARESSQPVAMHVYSETPRPEIGVGSHWDLRSWLATASKRDTDQLYHARINASDLGILHLVVPRSFAEPVRAILPRAPLVLEIDPRWQRHDADVFVSRGHHLHPPLPDDNPDVVEQMKEALWKDGSPENDRILLFQVERRDGETDTHCLRVAKSAFRPLAEQMIALNMLLTERYQVAAPASADFAKLFKPIATSVEQALAAHAANVYRAIEDAWSGPKADLNEQRRRVASVLEEHNALLAEVERLRDLSRDRLQPLFLQERRNWVSFIDALLTEDRSTLPESRRDLAKWLEQLDSARRTLIALLEGKESSATRAALAQRLEALATSVRDGDVET